MPKVVESEIGPPNRTACLAPRLVEGLDEQGVTLFAHQERSVELRADVDLEMTFSTEIEEWTAAGILRRPGEIRSNSCGWRFTAVVYPSLNGDDAAGFERSSAFALINTALTIAPAATTIAPTAKATVNPCTTAFGASRGP
jgi:hypothetical protein